MCHTCIPRAIVLRGADALVALALAFTAFALPAKAQPLPSWTLSEVQERLDLVERLVAYGRQSGEPLSLLAAAQMTITLDATASNARIVRGGYQPPHGVKLPNAEEILHLAARLSEHRTELRAVIEGLSPVSAKGASRGPRIGEHVLGPKAKLELEVDEVMQGQPAQLELASPQLEKLALLVMSPEEAVICAPADGQRPKQCRWTPRVNGTVLARIRNLADQTVSFRWGHN